MPIQINCQCGKSLKVPDAAAGKAVKCPGCGATVRVPSGSGGTPKQAAQRAAEPQESAAGRINDLFDEEGMTARVEAICPSCRSEMPANAVLCTKCGYHKESGQRFESHQTAGVDIDHGTLALQKAEQDMVKDAEMQATLIRGGGMPWWALALVLFSICSGLSLAVLYVNSIRRTEPMDFDVLGVFFLLVGFACTLVALGAYWMIVVHGIKKMGKKGLLNLIPPYAFYYVFINAKTTWKFLATAIVLGGIAGGLFAAASSRGI